MSTLFKRVVMIDWSGRNAPSRARESKDAIWIADGTRSRRESAQYFRTRHASETWLLERLREETVRTLVGFDFPFGYPSHTGGPTMPSGRALCEMLASRISDDARNRSNRFAIAGELNEELAAKFGGDGPFWGCPPARANGSIRPTKPLGRVVGEYRVVEEHQRRAAGASPKSAWQLLGAGSVGSQSLLGLATIGRLLRDEKIASRARIWPFETGWGDEMRSTLASDAIVFAEIYPSLFNDRAAGVNHHIHDARQVIATRDAVLDASDDDVCEMLSPSRSISNESRRIAATLEGWILGVR